MALDEAKILSNKFIFVSYSHVDRDAVREDMSALLARGVRVWYDENMRLGDDWTEIAKRVLMHENCVGALFYNSPSAFISTAVQIEQNYARLRMEKGNFEIWSVHIDSETAEQIFVKACALTTNQKEYIFQVMPVQTQMFTENNIYLLRDNSQSTVDYLYDNIAVPYNIVDNEDNFMDNVQRNSISSSRHTEEITLGKYIAVRYIGPEQPNGDENQRFGAQENLAQLDGEVYTMRDLHWRLLYVHDGKAVLLCTQILAQMTFEQGQKLLSDTFSKIAFSSEELKKLGTPVIRYMTSRDVERCFEVHNEDALKLSNKGEFAHWWIDEDGLTASWKQTYSDDFRYKKGFIGFMKKGVRPVIEIPTKSFTQ